DVASALPPEAGLPAPPAHEMNAVLNTRKERNNALKSAAFSDSTSFRGSTVLQQHPPPITFYAIFVNTSEGFFANIFY
ncbi:MAG: hypothetical protein IJ828_09410, partial [Treponema sp.]|nr:hypothetical protein [Treponema sp.]